MVELHQMRPPVGFFALSLGLGLAACSSNNDTSAAPGSNSAGADSPVVSCAADPRAETFKENLTQQGDSLKSKKPGFSFVLVKGTDEPPAVENQSWTLKILDANGKPVTDAQVTLPSGNARPADPWMPDHGHGSVGAAKSNGDGTYTISNLYFFMAGIWSTYISATSGSTTDSTTFTFCVGG